MNNNDIVMKTNLFFKTQMKEFSNKWYIYITPIIKYKRIANENKYYYKSINEFLHDKDENLAGGYYMSGRFPLIGIEQLHKGYRNMLSNNILLHTLPIYTFNKYGNIEQVDIKDLEGVINDARNRLAIAYQNSRYNNNLYVELNNQLYNAFREDFKEKLNGILKGTEKPPTGGKARKTRSKKSRKIRVKKYRKSKQVRIKKFKKTNKNKKITKRFRKTNKSRKVRR